VQPCRKQTSLGRRIFSPELFEFGDRAITFVAAAVAIGTGAITFVTVTVEVAIGGGAIALMIIAVAISPGAFASRTRMIDSLAGAGEETTEPVFLWLKQQFQGLLKLLLSVSST
jgi:hypothetical protein